MAIRSLLSRTGTKFLLKTGYISSSPDTEYETYKTQFQAIEAQSVRLQKHLRGYFESLNEVVFSHIQIVDTLASFYGEKPGDASKILRHYREALLKIQESMASASLTFHSTVYHPVTTFNSNFADINDAIVKRDQKKEDYDALNFKVKRLQNKNSTSPANLEKQTILLASVKNSFESLNTQLKTELPQLFDIRIPYLSNSFEAFIKLQIDFAGLTHKELNVVQEEMTNEERRYYANGGLEGYLDGILDNMRQLTITR